MKYSVIIPLFNKEKYIEKAIQSVLTQTCHDYELIVIDDGSTDDSYNVAKKSLDGTNATLIKQNNCGVSMTRNRGVSISQGEFICFLDADDWWDVLFLEKMSDLISSYPEAGIYGVNYYYVKNNKPEKRINIPTGYFNYFKEYSRLMQMPLTSISVAIPRNVFDETGGFRSNIRLGEDFLLWAEIALHHKIAFLNTPLAYYNQDVDKTQRGVGILHDPSYHFLWNLDAISKDCDRNEDFNQLIDNLRAYCLIPYYLSPMHHEEAVRELRKINWSNQPRKIRFNYRLPLGILRTKQNIMRIGSVFKGILIRLFNSL